MFDERPLCTICQYPVAEVQCCDLPFCLFCINKHEHHMTPRAIKWGNRVIAGAPSRGIPQRQIPRKDVPRKDIIERNGKKFRIVLLDG